MIHNTSSQHEGDTDAGRVGSTGEVVHSGCKGATIAFAKALAREVARSNVTANTISPGPTDTPAMDAFVGSLEQGQEIRDAMVRGVPLGRTGVPDDYPGLVAFLASDDAAFMTGQTISVSGGLSMHGHRRAAGKLGGSVPSQNCSCNYSILSIFYKGYRSFQSETREK